MPYVYDAVLHLEMSSKVEDGDCVDLIKHYVVALKNRGTFSWRPGEKVMTSQNLKPGTVIATFLCGQYPQGRKSANKHAAFFLSYVGPRYDDGTYREIMVMDQWRGVTKLRVSARPIRSKGTAGSDCKYGPDAGVSNNLDTFYVVE